MADLPAAVADFRAALNLSQHMENYRGITDAGGELASAYLKSGQLQNALAAVNSAIEANTHIPDELYLVPRNLAIKAAILAQMGKNREAEQLYKKSILLVNGMLQHVLTSSIERQLLAEMSDLYSGYFALLCAQHRYNEALAALESVRGRIETEALEHHTHEAPHAPTPEERALTALNLKLIRTDDPGARAQLENAIYSTELNSNTDPIAKDTIGTSRDPEKGTGVATAGNAPP